MKATIQKEQSSKDTIQESHNEIGTSADLNMDTALMQQKSQEHSTMFANSPKPMQMMANDQNNTGLPDNLKNGMEAISGMDLSDVQVHRNSSKPAKLDAHAYAQGNEIHLGSGQEKHLPHELGHIVQQAQGKVQATTQMQGVAVNDDASLENEATKLGEKALQMKSSDSVQKVQTQLQSNTVQKMHYFSLTGKKEDISTLSALNNILENTLFKDKVVITYTTDTTAINNAISKCDINFTTMDTKDIKEKIEDKIKELEPKHEWLDCTEGQISNILGDKTQGLLSNVKHNSKQVYHIDGKYPSVGKPLWILDGDNIKVIGMFKHPGSDNQTYKKMTGSTIKEFKIPKNGKDISI